MQHSFFDMVLVLLAAATLTVAFFSKLRLSPILGYLVIGAVLGPHALGWLPDSHNTRLLAEFGVVFLMFTIGLEFSLPRLLAQKRLVLGAGFLQVVLGTLVFGAAAMWFGLSPEAAFITGGALTMSSTAIVLKQLDGQRELNAAHGQIAIAVLLFQDLAAIPFLVMLPILGSEMAGTWQAIGVALARAVLVFVVLLVLGRWLLRPVLHAVSAARSLELFMLTTLLLALSAAWFSALMGLSPALGAFMAGMVVGETEFRHQLETDILPFKDLLLGLFFVTIGMQLDYAALPRHAITLAWLVPALIVGKVLINALVAKAAGARAEAALRSALVLAQGGEFGLLLLSMAAGAALLPDAVAQPLLTAVVVSMALAPLLLGFNADLASALLRPRHPSAQDDQADRVAAQAAEIEQHVLICGFGRFGQRLARILEGESIPYLALDLDPAHLREARASGMKASFGDATRPALLKAAGLERARALVVSFDDARSAAQIVAHVQHLQPGLPVLVRGTGEADEEHLRAAGADVFPERLEAGLMFAARALLLLGVDASRVQQRLDSIRDEDYLLLRGAQ